jgi:hypothetical protein
MNIQIASNIVGRAISSSLPALPNASIGASLSNVNNDEFTFIITPFTGVYNTVTGSSGNASIGIGDIPYIPTITGYPSNGFSYIWPIPNTYPTVVPMPIPNIYPVVTTPGFTEEQMKELQEFLEKQNKITIGDKELKEAAKQELQREITQEELDDVRRLILNREEDDERTL